MFGGRLLVSVFIVTLPHEEDRMFSIRSTMCIVGMLLLFKHTALGVRPDTEPLLARSTAPHGMEFALRVFNSSSADQFAVIPVNAAALIKVAGFDPKRKTILHFHGYTENADTAEVTTLARAFVRRGSENWILVDWSPYTTMTTYLTAVVGSERASTAVAGLIDDLVEHHGVDINLFHVMGQSLGAHSAGFVGKKIQSGKLQRITGLDPAGPLFNIHISQRAHLSPDDAILVDVLHTDRGGYGTVRDCGTVDFYLNENGVRYQPGCPWPSVPFTSGDLCSHMRGAVYFAESVLNEDAFLAVSCDSYDQFTTNSCRKGSQRMGYGVSNRTKGRYYLTTNSKHPFGRGPKGTYLAP